MKCKWIGNFARERRIHWRFTPYCTHYFNVVMGLNLNVTNWFCRESSLESQCLVHINFTDLWIEINWYPSLEDYVPSAAMFMMTSSNGNIFRVTDPLGGEFTGHRWIPLTKASDAELWRFLWSASEQTVEQTIETPVAIALIMISL